MIIFRYFAQEVITALAALTVILLLIFLSNEFVHYLQYAARGSMAGIFVLRLMMLEIPTLLGLLLPLGLFMGVLIAYGRLYADSEMTVLTACGMGRGQLICYTLTFSLIVAVITAGLVLWLGPQIMHDRNRILSVGQSASVVEMVLPKRFQSSNKGKTVFYVENMPRGRHKAEKLFFAKKNKGHDENGVHAWDVVTAKQASVKHDEKTDEDYVILSHGHQYIGTPGQKNYRIVKFDHYNIRIPQPKPYVRKKERAMPTMSLWPINNPNPKLAAELQWRLSVPIMALVLGFLAVPLSFVNARQGKFAKILPAVLIYIVYANMLFVTRRWIAAGTLSPMIGMWWLHASVVLLALFLLYGPNLRRRLTYQVAH